MVLGTPSRLRRTWLAGIAIGVPVASAAACSSNVVREVGATSTSSSGGATAASGSSTTNGSASSSSATGTGGGSASSSGGGADTGTPKPTSILRFQQCVGSSCSTGTSVIFQAGFDAPTSPSFGGAWCPGAASQGSCVVVECMPDIDTLSATAGALSISGGGIPAATTVMPGGPFDGPYEYAAAGTLFMSGEVLTVSATGGMVPAFGPQSVTAAPLVTLSSPFVYDSGITTVSTSSDLTVSWSGGQTGATMTLEGGASNGVAPFYFVCTFDASLGQGTVPMATLKPFSGLPNGYITYGQGATTTFTAGAYTLVGSATLYSTASVSFE